jgi:hypothetical protein
MWERVTVSVKGDWRFGTYFEKRRRIARQRERVQTPRAQIQERVTRAPGRDDDDGIDDMGQDRNPRLGDSDDKRRGARALASRRQFRRAGGADDADGQDAANVEEEQSIDVPPRCDGQVPTRVLHLACGGDEHLRREHERERRENQRRQQGHEASPVPL